MLVCVQMGLTTFTIPSSLRACMIIMNWPSVKHDHSLLFVLDEKIENKFFIRYSRNFST